jgi:acyl-CoA synthetase (AMP-forming)/AMP-acid ligase II
MRRPGARAILGEAKKEREMPGLRQSTAENIAVITGPYAAEDVPEVSLPAFVMNDWQQRGDRTALIDASTGRSFSYSELAAAVGRAASALVTRGLVRGDVLALCAPNAPDFALTYYSALAAGAVVRTLSLDLAEAEARSQLAQSTPQWLATTPDLAAMLTRAADARLKGLFLLGDNGAGSPIPQPAARGGASPLPAIDPEELAVLLSSSGTTGLPKTVMLTHRSLVGALCSFRAAEPVGEDDVVLAALPLCHVAGMQVVMNHALSCGGTVVTLPQFELSVFLEAIERYRVTRIVVAPPIVHALASHPLVDRYDLSSLRVLACGAAPLGGEMARAAAQRLGCRIKQGYGMTEAVAICMAPDDGADRPESIGPPLPGVECRVIDRATNADLPAGEPGELLVRSPAQMRGYLGNEEATRATIDADGWLHTGDIVRVDPEGWFHIVDRVKELIKVNGRQVSPAELEQILLTHPAVADAAVIGVPDERAGEVPKALVVLRSSVEPAQLLAHVRNRVSPHKQIRHLEVVREIPTSPSGKILRRMLVDRERMLPRRALLTGDPV